MRIYALQSLLRHSDPATGTFIRQFPEFTVFLNRQAAVPILRQLRLPIITSFTSHAVILWFGVAQEHSTLVISNPDGAGWALTCETVLSTSPEYRKAVHPCAELMEQLSQRLSKEDYAQEKELRAQNAITQYKESESHFKYDFSGYRPAGSP